MEFSGVGAPMPPTIYNPAPPPSSDQARQAQPNAQPPTSGPSNSGPAPGTPDDSDRGQTVDVQA